MIWQFIILNNRTSTETIIDEPPGWDKNRSEIIRDPDWNGIFFENSGELFEWYDIAEALLREEYDVYGVQADMNLVIKQNCGQGLAEYYRGRFDFAQYDHICADLCYVKCPVESLDDITSFRNRKNQKADLEATKAFDGIVNLTPYAKLPFDLILPSKGIFIQDRANNEKAAVVEQFEGGLQPTFPSTGGAHNLTTSQIEFGLPDNQLQEIGSFQVGISHLMDLTNLNGAGPYFAHFPPGVFPGSGIWPLNLNPFENFTPGSPNYTDIENPVLLEVNIQGALDVLECYLGTCVFYLLRLPDRPGVLTNGEADTDYEYIAQQALNNTGSAVWPSGYNSPNSGALAFTFNYSGDIVLSKNDRFYLFLSVTEGKSQTEIDNVTAGAKALKLTLDINQSFVKISNLSHTNPTLAKAFAINETISRVAEVITNDKLRAYSEYFGRIDSEPYAMNEDGCGSLEIVTNGLRIRRQENKIPGKTTPFSLSMDDLFNGLNPIHNIGIGIEPDILRPGYNRLRVEPWHYFYNEGLIMSCTNVARIERKVYEKEIYATFRYGYQKWEAEEYNGLDEFLTKRIYRTTLSQVTNELVKLSQFIASGYAAEVTRRKGNIDSKDWRYDKETFIICCSRIQRYRVKFDPDAGPHGTVSFEFLGDPAVTFSTGIGGTFTVDILGSQFNDGTMTFVSYDYVGTHLILYVDASSAPITAELTSGVSFPSAIYSVNSLFVEVGNIDNPANIIDPGTIYNYRISPIRNAMRWMNKVLESYRQFDADAKIIFTDGDGNIFAEGEMESITCRLEIGVIAENATLSKANFDDPDVDAKPFLIAERVIYQYPMNVSNYLAMKANPGGKIYFENECDRGYGWIDKITYTPEEGMANFNLIPKKV